MGHLTSTQCAILNLAYRRPDRLVLPLPKHQNFRSLCEAIDELTASGLIKEVEAEIGEPVWRKTTKGDRVTLLVVPKAEELAEFCQDMELRMRHHPGCSHPKNKYKVRVTALSR
jgi:hypothetical protein